MLLVTMMLSLTREVKGVVSPLDKVTDELQLMKETVNSIQASLITSVSLIQGKNASKLSLEILRFSQNNQIGILS